MLKHCSKRLARIDALHKTLPCVHASVALQTIATQIGHDPDPVGGLVDCTQFFAQFCNYGYVVNDMSGLHKLWYPSIRDTSTWSKFGAHGEHGDVFLFSNLGAF